MTIEKEITHTIAISKPPPKASPSMAATDGFLAAEKNTQHFYEYKKYYYAGEEDLDGVLLLGVVGRWALGVTCDAVLKRRSSNVLVARTGNGIGTHSLVYTNYDFDIDTEKIVLSNLVHIHIEDNVRWARKKTIGCLPRKIDRCLLHYARPTCWDVKTIEQSLLLFWSRYGVLTPYSFFGQGTESLLLTPFWSRYGILTPYSFFGQSMNALRLLCFVWNMKRLMPFGG
ncbi:hypothetical protein LXL04_029883 [Taraxacum kok-saghyz]